MAYLTLVLESREVQNFSLNASGVTTIGRAQDNDIVINNLALSRRHAQVEPMGRSFAIVDLKSQNGVFVNGERVRDRRVLVDKDAVALGTYQFVFRADLKTQDRRSAPPRRASSTEQTNIVKAEERVPLLVLKYNEVELQRHTLHGDCIIGRGKDCDVQIAERRLSRKHCQIFRGEGGQFFLKDLGSQNGTYVNRRRIRGFHELRHGDILNFAEYVIVFLGDLLEYRGPDSAHADPIETVMPPSLGNDRLAAAETVMPPAYSDQYGYEEPGKRPVRIFREESSKSAVRPRDLDEDPEASGQKPRPPVVMSPSAAKERRKRNVEPLIKPPGEAKKRRPPNEGSVKVRPVRPSKSPADRDETAPPKRQSRPPPSSDRPRRKKKSKKGKKSVADGPDVPDNSIVHHPDEALDDWYSSRDQASRLYEMIDEEGEEKQDDDAMLAPPDAASQVSRVLSTMMVDKRELERNLKRKKARERRFSVEVFHGDKEIFKGSLSQAVTILGTDKEADIRLKGRYVAGRHSLLVRVRDSLLLVRLGSSSAARVNGLPKLQAFLKDGDQIQIDETTIKIIEG